MYFFSFLPSPPSCMVLKVSGPSPFLWTDRLTYNPNLAYLERGTSYHLLLLLPIRSLPSRKPASSLFFLLTLTHNTHARTLTQFLPTWDSVGTSRPSHHAAHILYFTSVIFFCQLGSDYQITVQTCKISLLCSFVSFVHSLLSFSLSL